MFSSAQKADARRAERPYLTSNCYQKQINDFLFHSCQDTTGVERPYRNSKQTEACPVQVQGSVHECPMMTHRHLHSN